jgi:ATP synthase protein I
MTEPDDPSSLKDLDRRLTEAQTRRQAVKDRGAQGKGRAADTGMGLGFRIAVDMLAALLVGVGIGLLLDRWLNTAPLFLILFLFLGGAAGVLNVYRTASRQGMAVGYRKDDKVGQARKTETGSGREE